MTLTLIDELGADESTPCTVLGANLLVRRSNHVVVVLDEEGGALLVGVMWLPFNTLVRGRAPSRKWMGLAGLRLAGPAGRV